MNAEQILNDLIEFDYTECAFREFFNRIESPIKIKKKRIIEYSIERKENFVEIYAKSKFIPAFFKTFNAKQESSFNGELIYSFSGNKILEEFYQDLPNWQKRCMIYDIDNKLIDYSGSSNLIFLRYVNLDKGIKFKLKTILTDEIISQFHESLKIIVKSFYDEALKHGVMK